METYTYPTDQSMSVLQPWQQIFLLLHGKGRLQIDTDTAIYQTNIFYISNH
jgi:hypothetical protein